MKKSKPRCLKIELLEDFISDEPIFVDANILLYDSLKTPEFVESCESFLKRIERGEVEGITSVLVLNEIWFKLIVVAVVREHGIAPTKVARFIKRNPHILEAFNRERSIVNEIEGISNLEIVDISKDSISIAKKYSKKYLLLTNDALHLAVMKANNILNLASNDSDFERVEWLKLYKP